MAEYYKAALDISSSRTVKDPDLELVIKFFQAVEAEDGPTLQTLMFKVKKVEPAFAPLVLVPNEVYYETMARLLLMDEVSTLELLLDWYHITSFARTKRDKISEHWMGLAEFLKPPAKALPEKQLEKLFRRITKALCYVIKKFSDARLEEGPSRFDSSPSEFGNMSFHIYPLSVALYTAAGKLIRNLFVIHQQLLDAALEDLNSNPMGTKLLALFKLLEKYQEIKRLYVSQMIRCKSQFLVELTNTDYIDSSREHWYLDIFLWNTSQKFEFTPYDRDATGPLAGKVIDLRDLLDLRWKQVEFLMEAFSIAVPGTTIPTELREQKAARKKLIETINRKKATLFIKNEDDLVEFSQAFVTGQMNAGPKKSDESNDSRDDRLRFAMESLHEFLNGHLANYTSHSKYNLVEDTNYFNRSFPRALNGGAIQDCGVYAVILSYLFLTLADLLKTYGCDPKACKVSFVHLPLHVGLIIEMDKLLPVIVHNNTLWRISPGFWKKARDEWEANLGDDVIVDSDSRDSRFLEDIAALLFIRDVDLPMNVSPITKVSIPPKKSQIWDSYQKLVVRSGNDLFSERIKRSGTDEYQFDLEYLAIMVLEKRWHDKKVVEFWEKCNEEWEKLKKRDFAEKDSYFKTLDSMLKDVDESYVKEIVPKKKLLSEKLRSAREKLLGKKARIISSERLKKFATYFGYVGSVRIYLEQARTLGKEQLLESTPFEHEKRLMRYNE
jgi:hypothetical protein